MRLEKLTLQNFKNYKEAQLHFTGNIQCFVGNNGSGKTNLLDAIHYLSLTKSSINPSDPQNILKGEHFFRIRGDFTKAGVSHDVVCSFQDDKKKSIQEDGQEASKLSLHIGKYPVVLVAPNDVELIWDGSELRRKFFDSLLSQVDARYLESLIVYSHYLRQRNALLRIFFEQGKTDQDLLEAYDEKLIPAGEYVFQTRRDFLGRFQPLLESHYRFMAGEGSEAVGISYRSQLADTDFRSALTENRSLDIRLQRTTVGIHKDDFLFTIDGNDLKRWGSQGQQKSFLIGLKLCEFDVLMGEKKFKPLLLLDDIFDKLDDSRIRRLLQRVADHAFGQLFITDARGARSQQLLKDADIMAQLVEVTNGSVRTVNF